jgi:hypothetical protein
MRGEGCAEGPDVLQFRREAEPLLHIGFLRQAGENEGFLADLHGEAATYAKPDERYTIADRRLGAYK